MQGNGRGGAFAARPSGERSAESRRTLGEQVRGALPVVALQHAVDLVRLADT
jgi:hypothetical protein